MRYMVAKGVVLHRSCGKFHSVEMLTNGIFELRQRGYQGLYHAQWTPRETPGEIVAASAIGASITRPRRRFQGPGEILFLNKVTGKKTRIHSDSWKNGVNKASSIRVTIQSGQQECAFVFATKDGGVENMEHTGHES